MAPHVFLSHVSEDSQTVARLKSELASAGLITWLARDDIVVGELWMETIRKAIKDGAFFVGCFSEASVSRARTVMNDELLIAIEELRLRPLNRRWFIPLKLTPCEVPALDIGGGRNLNAIHHLEMYSDWDKNIAKLKLALGATTDAPRPKLSKSSVVLAFVTLVALFIYGLLAVRYWPASSPPSADQTAVAEDETAIGFLSEALAHIKADRLDDAYQAASSAEKSAHTPAVQNRASFLRLLLAISISEGHQMMGEALVKGREKAIEKDKLRYAELAVGQSMQSFKWAKAVSGSLDTLSSRNLPEAQFAGVELSNSLGQRMETGIQANQRVESGQGSPSDADLDRAAVMLTSQTLRFYVSKAFQPDAGKVAVMTKDLWSGPTHWSADLAMALTRHITKMSDKGIQMALAVEAQPPEARFSVGQNFGLGEELNVAFCRSLLESLRRYVATTRTKAASAQDAVELSALLQDIDRRLLAIPRDKGDRH